MSGQLTNILAGVPGLGVPQVESPLVKVSVVGKGEAVVLAVGLATHRDDVVVPKSDP